MRLPRDNFPDDTETYAFHQYRPKSVRWQRWGMMMGGGIGLLVGVMGASWLLLNNPFSKSVGQSKLPDYITPTPDISQTLPQGFPMDIPYPQIIQIPARIDEVGLGRRGYIFQPTVELLWCVASFGGTLEFYGVDEAVEGECIAGNATNELLVKFNPNMIYGVVVETAGAESVLFILPIE